MLDSGHSEKIVVARMRVRGAGIDPATARLRLASLLNAASLRTAGLGPSAIVVIKQIRDPLPGHLRLHQSGLLRPPPRWERAARARLEQLLGRAQRPVLGPVAETAEAVIFLDRSELLACSASDWCRYGALTRWWWRSLFGSEEIAPAIIRAWLAATEYVPAALDHLAKRGEATAFIRALKPDDSHALLRAVIRSFALREIERALDAAVEAKSTARGYEPKDDLDEAAALHAGREVSRRDARLVSPWPKAAREAEDGGLAPDAQALLGIGLMLQRAPAVVRSREFARSLFSWRRAACRAGRAPASSFAERKRAIAFNETEKGPQTRVTKQAHETEQLAERPESFKHDGEAAINGPTPSEKAANFDSSSQDGLSAASPAPAEVYRDGSDAGVAYGLEEQSARSRTTGASEADYDATWLEETQYETKFGGIFYLINLGIFLGLYGDFTAPTESAPPLSIWDFVALVGKEMLGEKIAGDPVWPLLADFAGRSEQQSPGHDFTPPESWRIPAEWLEPFAEKSVWQWEAVGGRLRVRHARGFPVLDVPLTTDEPTAQLLDEMEAYRELAEFELQAGTLLEEVETPGSLACWLGWLMPYVCARLERALLLSRAEELPVALCEHPARVICTATHLDIFLSLTQLPIGVRLSGLDRDPGWVPAAGRFIAFHFD